MRSVFIIVITIIASGCISADYKSGSYWVLDEDVEVFGSQAAGHCVAKIISTNNAISSSSQIISPYFVPLFYLSGKADKEIVVTIENQICPDLLITADRKNDLAFTANTTNNQNCIIRIAQPQQADRITIQASNLKDDCEDYSATLVKRSFFCVRATRFGGSPDCKRN